MTKTEIEIARKVKAVIKGTLKFFGTMVISLVVLVMLLIVFSSIFHVDLMQRTDDILELREVHAQEVGSISVMLSWRVLGMFFVIPFLFLWGYMIYLEYNKEWLI